MTDLTATELFAALAAMGVAGFLAGILVAGRYWFHLDTRHRRARPAVKDRLLDTTDANSHTWHPSQGLASPTTRPTNTTRARNHRRPVRRVEPRPPQPGA